MASLKASAACAAAILLLSGCGESTNWRSDPPSESTPVPAPDREKEFTDIPVPRDFVRDSGSFSTEHGTFRMCKLSYHGPLDPYRTTEFMQQQMDTAHWKLVDNELDNDVRILDFSKGTEHCKVTVRRERDTHSTLLTIMVVPSGPETPIARGRREDRQPAD